MIKKFDYENEISFKISKQQYFNALSNVSEVSHMPFVRVVDTYAITQKWFSEENLSNNITKRSRIRKYINKYGVSYEYTTKYYLNKSRIEINSYVEENEYDILNGIIYKDIAQDMKIRTILEDTETGIKYFADIRENEDNVTIEIEFADEKERAKFVVPKWLA
jgi:hypothetical protein